MMSIMANPVCDGLAMHAIRIINRNLPLLIENSKNEKARLNMQIAASMAGWAFSVAQVGLVHGMAHTLGALHHLPHGAACGIMLPKVMRFNVDHVTEKLAMAALALGAAGSAMSERDAALAAADAIETLMKKVDHPMRLRDVGVPEDNLPMCAFHAIGDTSVIFNGRPVSDPMEVLEVYKQAY
jgi:aldehyde dehydrogenase (NAD+)